MLAGACAGWAALALTRPEGVARTFGTTPSEIRALGIRDAGSAVFLALSPDPRPAIGVRVAFDLADTARYHRAGPAAVAYTLGFAAFGALGFLGRRG